MTGYQVHYSFTCKECEKPNDLRILVDAADKVQAVRSIKLDAVCKYCEAPIDQDQPFTASVK